MRTILSARFVKSAVAPHQFPEHAFPEYAFFGRSNAGKSSLINMLLNRKNLVKTGAKPGVTRSINFFAVNEATPATAFYVADLPGYGYAQLKKGEVRDIDKMLADYCSCRTALKIMFLLMDVRRPPNQVEKDICVFFASSGIEFRIIATKADKVSKSEQQKQVHALSAFFEIPPEEVILTSTLKKTGREKLLALV